MKLIVRLLIALGFGAALSGCVVEPLGPPRRACVEVAAPAPIVVLGGGFYHRW